MPSPDPAAVALCAWYGQQARSLPWRERPTPYHVLLSEFMCQQTRVQTAIPYFHRFVARWPDLESFAAATEAEVVEAWAGLGYYSRARRLHRCARAAVERGGLPRTADELRALPGIGPYTAGAIASIAFGQPTPAVDGNVERVLARLRGYLQPVDAPAGRRWVQAEAEALHHPEIDPGQLNQALMELGATCCTPRRPTCAQCPVAGGCVARAQSIVDRLPQKRPRQPPRPITGVAAVLRSDRGALLVRRAGEGLLGGLWTPPLRLDVPASDPSPLLQVFEAAGVQVDRFDRVDEVRHVFSHRDLRCTVFRATGKPLGDATREVRWAASPRGASRLAAKILEAERSRQDPLPLLAAEPPLT